VQSSQRPKVGGQSIFRRTLLGAIFCAGVALSSAAAWLSYGVERERAVAQLNRLSENRVESMAQRVREQVQVLEAVAAFLAARADTSGSLFSEFVTRSLSDSAERLEAVAWAPRVTHSQKEAFRSAVRLAGQSGFDIREPDGQGGYHAAERRDDYYPLTYVVPHVPNPMEAIGLDLTYSEGMQERLSDARDQARLLLQERDDEAGSTYHRLILPVYELGTPDTVEERRQALSGYLVGFVQFAELLSEYLPDASQDDYAVTVLLGDRELFGGVPQASEAGGVQFERQVVIGGETLVFRIVPISDRVSVTSWLPWTLLSLGLFLTLVLVLGIYLAQVRLEKTRVEKLVAERTAELEESQALLIQQEKLASLGQMVAGIAHEMNTPLGYIKGSLTAIRELLADIRQEPVAVEAPSRMAAQNGKGANLSEEFDEIFELIDNATNGTERVADLVLNLKNFGRMEGGEKTTVDLADCIRDAVELARHDMQKMQVEVETSLADAPSVEASAAQLTQVVLNLVTNAAQASERGQKVVVDLRAAQRDGHLGTEVTVTDQGQGMTEEVKKKVFDPFFTTKDVGEGMGLGMAIVQKIIVAHSGQVQIDTAPGDGTAFTIFFPSVQQD